MLRHRRPSVGTEFLRDAFAAQKLSSMSLSQYASAPVDGNRLYDSILIARLWVTGFSQHLFGKHGTMKSEQHR
jgi:hypothetical protein